MKLINNSENKARKMDVINVAVVDIVTLKETK